MEVVGELRRLRAGERIAGDTSIHLRANACAAEVDSPIAFAVLTNPCWAVSNPPDAFCWALVMLFQSSATPANIALNLSPCAVLSKMSMFDLPLVAAIAWRTVLR